MYLVKVGRSITRERVCCDDCANRMASAVFIDMLMHALRPAQELPAYRKKSHDGHGTFGVGF